MRDLWPVYLLRTLFLHLFIVSLCALCGYMLTERMAEPEHSYRLMHVFLLFFLLLLNLEFTFSSYLSQGCWKKSAALIALSLNLEEDYFEKIGALNKPASFLRLLHYPGLAFFFFALLELLTKSQSSISTNLCLLLAHFKFYLPC